jgi:hypothetical protein
MMPRGRVDTHWFEVRAAAVVDQAGIVIEVARTTHRQDRRCQRDVIDLASAI